MIPLHHPQTNLCQISDIFLILWLSFLLPCFPHRHLLSRFFCSPFRAFAAVRCVPRRWRFLQLRGRRRCGFRHVGREDGPSQAPIKGVEPFFMRLVNFHHINMVEYQKILFTHHILCGKTACLTSIPDFSRPLMISLTFG
jgi:hypothetical protein